MNKANHLLAVVGGQKIFFGERSMLIVESPLTFCFLSKRKHLEVAANFWRNVQREDFLSLAGGVLTERSGNTAAQ